MEGYIFLLLLIIFTSFGQLFLKKHNMQNKKMSYDLILSLLFLVSIPLLSYLSLIYLDFFIVFLSNSLAIVLVVLISNIFLKEHLTRKKVFGIVMILIGMLILNG